MAKKEKTESVRINRELMDKLRFIAKERGAMVSWVANKAIAEWLQWSALAAETFRKQQGKP